MPNSRDISAFDRAAHLAAAAASSTEYILRWEDILEELPELDIQEQERFQDLIDHHRLVIGDIEGLLETEDVRELRARADREGRREYVRAFDAELQRRGLVR